MPPDIMESVNMNHHIRNYMTLREGREYVCVQCGRRETVGDALLSTCQQCGSEMRNVELIRE